MEKRKDTEKKEGCFTDSEMRNFTSIALSMLETQIKLLAAIAVKTGIDRREINEMLAGASLERESFEKLICEGGKKPVE
jgi:hypothetical protein